MINMPVPLLIELLQKAMIQIAVHKRVSRKSGMIIAHIVFSKKSVL
jgi:hypothetical protein